MSIQYNVPVSEETDILFRQAITKKLGMKKGNIKLAVEEAMRLWAKEAIK